MSTFDHIKFGDNLNVTDEGSGVIRVDGYGAQGPQGPTGPTGPTGPVGPAGASGVIPGGTRGQALTKQSSTDGDSVWSPRVSFPPDGLGGHILFDGDTDLYRPVANVLVTDGHFKTGVAVEANQGTANSVFVGYTPAGGYTAGISFGASQDTEIHRVGPGLLRTDGGFSVGSLRTPQQSDLTMTSGAVTVTGGAHRITNVSGGTVLNTINGGVAGMILVLQNMTGAGMSIGTTGNIFVGAAGWPTSSAKLLFYDASLSKWILFL